MCFVKYPDSHANSYVLAGLGRGIYLRCTFGDSEINGVKYECILIVTLCYCPNLKHLFWLMYLIGYLLKFNTWW